MHSVRTPRHLARAGQAAVVALTVALAAGLAAGPALAALPAATGTPGAPSGLSAIAGEGSATLTWSAPSSTGTSAISSYTITVSPGGATLATTGPWLTQVVPGLTDGTPYTFTVAATNAQGTGPASSSSSAVTPSHPGGQYHALTPYRICDTRAGNPSGLSGSDAQCAGKALRPQGQLSIAVADTSPAGASSGGVPAAGATAAVLNVTATGGTAGSYLTVWPAGKARPTASSLNWRAGQSVPNLVQVPLGTGGKVSFYNANGDVNLIVDVAGYVSASPSAVSGLYHAPSPYRICDTRAGNPSGLSGTDAQCTGKALGPGGQLTIAVAGTAPSSGGGAGVPGTGAGAVVLNVTVAGPTSASYLTVWPAGASRPTASNLNWISGENVPNRVVVPLGSGGKVSFYNHLGTANLIVDVGGWYTDASSATAAGSYFSGVTPTRICDTRAGNPSGLSGADAQCAGKTLGPGGQLTFAVAGLAGVTPAGSDIPATAAVLNVTAVDTTTASYLTAWPAGVARPTASDLNWTAGRTVANDVVVRIGSAGEVSVYNAKGSTDVIVDVVGFDSGGAFVPAATVVLSPVTIAAISSVSTDESTITFTGAPSQVTSLVPGDVIDAGVTAQTPYGLLRKVSRVATSGGDMVVTTVAATISDAVTQGSVDYSAAPKSYLAAPSPSLPGAPSPHEEGVDPEPTMTAGCGPQGGVSLDGGITNFTLTPSFHASIGGSFWSPTVSVTSSIRVDEAYNLDAKVSAGANCSVNQAIIPNTPIGAEIPVDLGPLVFTLTPVYSVDATFSMSGSVSSTEVEVDQAASRTAGFTYGNTSGFHPTGSSGCDAPIPAGTPLCTTVTKPPPGAGSTTSYTMSGGLEFTVVLAIDYIPGGVETMGPFVELGAALEATVQNATPIWSVGLNLKIAVGLELTLFNGFVHAAESVDLVDTTLVLAHAVEVATTKLPDATGGTPYSTTLSASGGIAPYTWAFASGSSPPSWLVLTPKGVLESAQSAPAVSTATQFQVAVALSDSTQRPVTATATLSLTVEPGSQPSIIAFSASPSTLPTSGGTTTLSWKAAYATSCTVISKPSLSGLPQGAACQTTAGGDETAKVSLPAAAPGTAVTYTFTLTAAGASGTTPATGTTTVVVGSSGTTVSWKEVLLASADLPGDLSCATASHCVYWGGESAYVTSDGGSTWTQEAIPNTSGQTTNDTIFSSISCAEAPAGGIDCVIVGSDVAGNNAAWVSSDGGATWAEVTVPNSGTQSFSNGAVLASVSCATGGSGGVSCVIVGTDSAFDNVAWVSIDGGATWTEQTVVNAGTVHTGGFNAVSCATASTCAAVGLDANGQSAVWTTADGGAAWTEQLTPAFYPVVIACPTASTCVVDGTENSTGSYAAWVTTDGGATWTEGALPGLAQLAGNGPDSLACATTSTCVTVGVDASGNVAAWVTTDGGMSWTEEALPGAGNINTNNAAGGSVAGISCASSGSCLVTGTDSSGVPVVWLGNS